MPPGGLLHSTAADAALHQHQSGSHSSAAAAAANAPSVWFVRPVQGNNPASADAACVSSSGLLGGDSLPRAHYRCCSTLCCGVVNGCRCQLVVHVD
jgi:hypothetical protein